MGLFCLSPFAVYRGGVGEFLGCPAGQSPVRTALVVLRPPGMNNLFCYSKNFDPIGVENKDFGKLLYAACRKLDRGDHRASMPEAKQAPVTTAVFRPAASVMHSCNHTDEEIA
jgi:hypothetical protein